MWRSIKWIWFQNVEDARTCPSINKLKCYCIWWKPKLEYQSDDPLKVTLPSTVSQRNRQRDFFKLTSLSKGPLITDLNKKICGWPKSWAEYNNSTLILIYPDLISLFQGPGDVFYFSSLHIFPKMLHPVSQPFFEFWL